MLFVVAKINSDKRKETISGESVLRPSCAGEAVSVAG